MARPVQEPQAFRCPQLWVHAALLSNCQTGLVPESSRRCQIPADASGIHEAPGTEANRPTQAQPCSYPGHDRAKTDQSSWHSRQAKLPDAAATSPAPSAGTCDEQAGPDISRLTPAGVDHGANADTTRQPTISVGAAHLLAEWDWEANERRGWRPDQVTLGSSKKVHWMMQDECKLGLVHRWQASPNDRTRSNTGSPFPSGKAVCACNSLAVQCPEAANLWDFVSNGELSPGDVPVHSHKTVAWKDSDGRQWQRKVQAVVKIVRREPVSQI